MSSPPRVVFVDHVARLSGGELALLRLASAFDGRIDPYVILGEEGPLVERLRALGVAVEVLPMDPEVRDARRTNIVSVRHAPRLVAATIRDAWRLRRRLRELDPDIVHTNSLKAGLYGGLAARLAGLPVVWHVRDRISRDYLPWPAVVLVRALARIVPSAVVANSRATLDTVKTKRQALVVYNLVLPDTVEPRRPENREAGRAFTVGMLGRIAPWKGQHLFLEAFALAFGGSSAQARVIGSPLFGEEDYQRQLLRQAQQFGIGGQVEFRGFREDVWAELREVDVLVHCSTIPEPFGQVVLEGMAASLPVIATEAGGPAEMISNGLDGVLVPPGNSEALAEALRRLEHDPSLRERLGRAGHERSKQFSPEAAVEHLSALYAGLLKRPGTPAASHATNADT
jgi:glycosyltransferase involved in cell wall biosynthesis